MKASPKALRVAIAGATGYTGAELLRLLVQHPRVAIVAVTSEQSAGEPLSIRLPFLKGICDRILEKLDPTQLAKKADLIFSALAHTKAMKPVQEWIHANKKVIDLSADYRLRSTTTYQKWYKVPHEAPALLKKAVYGLPEIHREKIARAGATRGASLIANPGCYPTGALLPLYPFLKSGEVDPTREIIIDAKSGLSGAGRTATDKIAFSEIHEGLTAYSLGNHRHIPEIEQEISSFGIKKMIFTPYLLPANRGILTTVYLPLKRILPQDALGEILTFYSREPFIRQQTEPPNLNAVKGSNYCDIAVFAVPKQRTAILISAIDNLGKGAAGQAIQNMNLLMGWEEREGLRLPGFFP